MNHLYILLLALWSAFNPSDARDIDEHTTQEWYNVSNPDEHATRDPWQMMNESHPTFSTDIYSINEYVDYEYTLGTEENENEPESDNVPEHNITVYRQTEDREHVIVLCKFGMTHGGQSIELSVESELNYTIEQCYLYYLEMSVFLVTVRPPASFTCVHGNLRSQTYNYSVSVSDHHEEGASLLYICFSSFIAVGLFIMTAAVIVINIRSKTKDADSTAVTNNDYVEA